MEGKGTKGDPIQADESRVVKSPTHRLTRPIALPDNPNLPHGLADVGRVERGPVNARQQQNVTPRVTETHFYRANPCDSVSPPSPAFRLRQRGPRCCSLSNRQERSTPRYSTFVRSLLSSFALTHALCACLFAKVAVRTSPLMETARTPASFR